MSKCQKKTYENNGGDNQNQEYGIFGKIKKMFSESLIRVVIAIFWICVLWICAAIFYHIMLIIWFILFLPVNPLTNYFIWMPVGTLFKFPLILVPVFVAAMIGTVFFILWAFINPIAYGIAAIVLWPLHPILDALKNAGIWDLFETLSDSKLSILNKFKRILLVSPFFSSNKNNNDEREISIDDIVGCNELDTGLFKALMNLFILKKDGVYVNNMAKLRITEDKKVKGAKNMIKITNEPNRLTEQQRAEIERCISQSVKSNANKSNVVDVLENVYKNEIIKSNCVKKYDGSNRKPTEDNEDHVKNFMGKMKKSSEAANRTFKKILNNDIDM